jgi:hypothetical protein
MNDDRGYVFAEFNAAQRFFCPKAILRRAAALTRRLLPGSLASTPGAVIAGGMLLFVPPNAAIARSNSSRSPIIRAIIESLESQPGESGRHPPREARFNLHVSCDGLTRRVRPSGPSL